MKRITEGERSADQIREHYLLEKKLATKLKNASKPERKHLYTRLYNELYQKLPHHPRWTRPENYRQKMIKIQRKMDFLKYFLSPEFTFLEIGPGDCLLSREISGHVNRVYALDVSDEVTRNSEWPENFFFLLSDGINVPIEKESVDIAFSNQMIEHLHPEDALDQVRNIFGALKQGGKYICVTPNRLSGPHDISKYFDKVATCFHLKEYTTTELIALFRKTGFSEISFIFRVRGKYFFSKFPRKIIEYTEKFLNILPHSLSKRLSRTFPVRMIINPIVVAIK